MQKTSQLMREAEKDKLLKDLGKLMADSLLKDSRTVGSLHPMMPVWVRGMGPHPQGGIFIPLCYRVLQTPWLMSSLQYRHTHTFSHILKPLPKDRQGDLKMKPSSFQGAERRIPPSPSSLLLFPVPNCSLGLTPDEPALGLLLCLCFMMFIITLWK